MLAQCSQGPGFSLQEEKENQKGGEDKEEEKAKKSSEKTLLTNVHFHPRIPIERP